MKYKLKEILERIGKYNDTGDESAEWDYEYNSLKIFNEGGWNYTILKKNDLIALADEIKRQKYVRFCKRCQKPFKTIHQHGKICKNCTKQRGYQKKDS